MLISAFLYHISALTLQSGRPLTLCIRPRYSRRKTVTVEVWLEDAELLVMWNRYKLGYTTIRFRDQLQRWIESFGPIEISISRARRIDVF